MGKTRDAGVGNSVEKDQPKFDPAEMARLYADIAEESSALVSRFMANHAEGSVRPISDELGISRPFCAAWSRSLTDPVRRAEPQGGLWQAYWSLAQSSWWKRMGQDSGPVAEAAKGDRG